MSSPKTTPTTTAASPIIMNNASASSASSASSINRKSNSLSLTSLQRRQLLLRQMDGGGRPSMCVQNIEAMTMCNTNTNTGSSIYWNQTAQDIKALDESELRKSHFESTDFVHELKLFLELAFTTALMYLGTVL
jgi:hypothetical protein